VPASAGWDALFVSAKRGQVSLLSMGIPPPIEMANLGMADSLILMVMALVVFGPRRLPQIGRQIGKLMYEFRKASNDFKFQMEEELRNSEESDRRKKEEERLKLMALAPPAEAPAELPAEGSVQTLEVPADAASGAASPYPEELQYPELAKDTPEPAQTEGNAQPAESEAEVLPRIQPPSTGEQVSAAAPNGVAAITGEPATAASPETTLEGDQGANLQADAASATVAEEAPAEQPSPVTEQEAHHG
jgi:sec-independent protein translocase protein TatB